VLGALTLVGTGMRWELRRRQHRRAAERALPGADGIVPGAHSLHLPATGPRAALLLHGFGDTPQTLGYLAGHLHRSGWAVRAPLLPGHGRTFADFTQSGCDQWLECAREELSALRARHDEVAIVGLSMGGALATVLAAEQDAPRDGETGGLCALALIAPYLSMPPGLRRMARLHRLWSPLAPVLAARGERSILDEDERARSLSYGAVSGPVLRELLAVVDRASAALPRVRTPTLVVHSRQDDRIPAAAAERAFALLGARSKRLEWVSDGGHVLTVDHGRERVQELVALWLEQRGVAAAAEA
jgi:carboxylesterase